MRGFVNRLMRGSDASQRAENARVSTRQRLKARSQRCTVQQARQLQDLAEGLNVNAERRMIEERALMAVLVEVGLRA
jgi:hypothetical protein